MTGTEKARVTVSCYTQLHVHATPVVKKFTSLLLALQVSDGSELGPLQNFLQWCDQVSLVLSSKVGYYCTLTVLSPNGDIVHAVTRRSL